MMDIEIEANDIVIKMLENRIKYLEKLNDDLEKEVAQLKSKPNIKAANVTSSIPKHLSGVHKAHLQN